MIPSGYKEDVVYSPIPTNGNGDLSFTRASNGTRVNSAGLVEVVSWNMAGYSEDFSNAYWTKNNIPVMAYNVATAPNGTMTADSIKSDSSSVYQSVSATTITVAPNSTVTLSIYIKKETSKTYFTGSYLYFTGGTTKLTYVLFDEVNGSINIIAPDEVSMVTSVESVGNWWRFIVTGTDTGNNTNLDFAFYGTLSQNGTSLNPGIGSVRTIWGAQVNIGSTAKPYFPTTDRLNVPRLTYQNGGGGCPSLLLEKQSTNYMPYSENISLWYAPADGVTLTSNTTDTVSPDGTNNASKIAIVSGSKRSYEITNSVAGVGTFSAYVKAGTSTSITLFTSSGSINIGYNLSTLAITTGSGTGTITSVGNGWYRITATNTLGASEVLQVLYTGTAGQTIYIWGFQVEASSYVTSYIFTNGASATRVADSCSKTGISSLIGSGTGTWFMDFEMVQGTGTGNPFAFDLSDGSTSNRLFLYWSEGVQTWYWGGADTSITLPSTLRKKVAVKFSSGTAKLFCNGSSISTLSISSAFTRLDIGQRFSNAFPMDGKINEAYFLTTSLTDAECQAITTI
jgi:hypothetical protein